jgi:hypothetical protein
MLKSLHFTPSSSSRYVPAYRFDDHRAVFAVSVSFDTLVQHCASLEKIGMIIKARQVCIVNAGFAVELSEWREEQDCNLELADVLFSAREEAVPLWCDTRVRDAVEYGEIVNFVSWDEEVLPTFASVDPWRFDM